jgi:hypothetical protein
MFELSSLLRSTLTLIRQYPEQKVSSILLFNLTSHPVPGTPKMILQEGDLIAHLVRQGREIGLIRLPPEATTPREKTRYRDHTK